MFFQAVESVGKPVLFIKDNKIVGKGISQMAMDGIVGVCVVDDAAKEFFKDDYAVKILGWKSTFFHYFTHDGTPAMWYEDEPDGRHLGTRVVDEFSFRWGMVPESFKDVDGHRSAIVMDVADEGSSTADTQ